MCYFIFIELRDKSADQEPVKHALHHQCHICGIWLTQKSKLSRHVAAVHLNERPFKCPKCPKAFNEQYNMKKHLSTVHAP